MNDTCTKIIVESSNNEIDWLDGTFILDPTLVADGRPVYVELFENEQDKENPDIVQRSIYHYSHERASDISEYESMDFSGRWILGNSMYSANGWFCINSWSISPGKNMMHSLVNPQNTNNNKVEWRIYLKNEWTFDTSEQITLSCHTQFDDITKDWLFISTPNKYQFNILNEEVPGENGDALNSITEETIYGFYYRISDEYWRKIESKIFFRKRDLKKDPLQSSATFGDDDDIEYSFIYYDNYTNYDGTPNMENVNGYKLVTYGVYNDKLTDLNEREWYVIDANDRQYQGETISVNIVMTKDSNDDIYAAFRRYWKDIKLQSFEQVTNEIDGLTDDQKKKLIVNTNNGLPFMMLGLGTGGLHQRTAKKSLEWGLNDIGYRVIDGAQAYENEIPLGIILNRKLGNNFDRDDIYITSKVWPTDLGFIQTYQAILASLNKVKTNYFDLYMIHWNRCNPDISWMDCEQASNRPWGQSWEVMEKLYGEGILLNIGISNYDFGTFNEMLDSHNFQIIPQVLQNYFDISHADWELASYVNKYGTIYQGYAQYRGIAQAEQRAKSGQKHYKQFKDKLEEISLRSTNGKASASQVLLRWLFEKNIATIPRSSQRSHLRDNWNIWEFQLTEKDINELTELSIEQNRKQQKGEL